ncbi:DUF222 domain-containing protein [Streptomyces sp. NP160]|uniref:HNH endonuclease signature motif containing protein n=1 Tax=Streptomyces sp. NP160 TaxID=2586637 RepID=UPI001119C316|nr:HNH endonuclease signature motif containing protein [Streptomyces sp. NP160]TNM59558.1 DUF222 domain-containing protein [Streptomyces sp. NP160]
MTWTATETPHEGDSSAVAGGGPEWVVEPLAPGALGADRIPCTDEDGDGGPLDEGFPLEVTGPLAEALSAARTAVDDAAAAACYLTTLSPHQRVAALGQAARTRHVLEAAVLRLTASFTPEDLTVVGATNPTDLLLTHTGADARRASTEAHLAKALTAPIGPLHAPEPDPTDTDTGTGTGSEGSSSAHWVRGEGLGRVGEQHAAGRISTDIASLARRTLASLPRSVQRAHAAEADHLLAATLPGLTHPQAAIACEVLAQKLDPARADRGFDPDAIDKRYVNLTVHEDGSVDIRGHLDAVTGAELKAAIDHYAEPEPTTTAPLADQDRRSVLDPDLDAEVDAEVDVEVDAHVDADGDDQPLPGLDGDSTGSPGEECRRGRRGRRAGVVVRDERTAPQRRADALGLLARLGRTGDQTRGGEPPRIIVTATAEQLTGVPGSGRATCETTRRGLSTAALQHLACSALLHAVTLSCQGPAAAALALGRSVRLFSPAQRRAMLARDGGCVIPGCTAPPGWWEAHHVHEWAAGGPTDVDQGVLLCGRHHVLVTVGVWAVRMVDGAPQVRPPVSIDPLQRWLLNPRRAVEHSTAQRAEQMLLRVDPHRCAAPPGPPPAPPRGDVPRPSGAVPGHGPGRPEDPPPDIPSPRSTCAC